MPIIPSQPPEQVFETTRSTLKELANGPTFRVGSLEGVRTCNLTLWAPHQVYTFALEDLAQGKGLEAARHVAWEYFVEQDKSVVATAEVGVGEAGGAKNSFLLTGRAWAQAEKDAWLAASKLSQVRRGSFEARLLRIPALNAAAVWLTGGHGREDVVIPVKPAPVELDAGRTYTSAELIEVLREPARWLLERDLEPEDTPSRLGG